MGNSILRGPGIAAALAIVVVSAIGCGAPAIDVSGAWTGASNLFVTTGETLSSTEGVSVSQKGNDISFFFAGCEVEASASSETTFAIHGFDCQKQVNSKLWHLTGGGGSKITASANQFNMQLTGTAQSGNDSSSFQWTYNGSR